MSVIDEPAAAIAASRCLTARTLARRPGDEWTEAHPRQCDWCDFPLAELARMVAGWNDWADGRDRGRSAVYQRHAAQAFAELARRDPREAERQVVAAQGLVDPVQPDPPPQAHGPASEDVDAWLS